MGANQSKKHHDQDGHRITVVNPSPSSTRTAQDEIYLPTRVPPILSVENGSLDFNRHGKEFRVDPQLWINLVSDLERYTQSRSDLISNRQNRLRDKILYTDEHVQNFTESYINVKHKALARMKDDCRKTDELRQSLNKCLVQSEICLDMLNKLNFLLPDEDKLEPLDTN